MDILDINYNILSRIHPYYLVNYLLTCKSNKLLCEQLKYNFLREWVINEKLDDIYLLLPQVSFRDIVELSLFYSPIPESIGKFDRNSLFYSACKHKYYNPEYYLGEEISIPSVSWACYKFNRIDIIERLIYTYNNCSKIVQRNEYIEVLYAFHNMLNLKLGLTKYACIWDTYNLSWFLKPALYLLSKEELFEAIVIMCKLDIMPTQIQSYILNGELNIYEVVDFDLCDMIGELLLRLDLETEKSIILKYFPDYEHPRRDVIELTLLYWGNCSGQKEELTALDYYLHPEFILKLSKEEQLIAHLTRGDYISYMRLRNEGVKLEINDCSVLCANSMGHITINSDLTKEVAKCVNSRNLRFGITSINKPDEYLEIGPLSYARTCDLFCDQEF